MTPWRWLWRILKPHRSCLLLAGALALGACWFALANPLLVQKILVAAGQSQKATAVTVLCSTLLAVALLHALASTANTWLLGKLGLEIVRDLRLALYERLQQMPMSWFDRTPSGGIISRLMDDVVAIQSFVSSQTLVTLIDLCIAVGAGIWLCTRSWQIAIVIFTLVPIYVLIFRVYTGRIRTGTFEVRQQLDRLFGGLKQKIDSIQVIRATATEASETSEFSRQIRALHEPRLRVTGLGISFSNLCIGIGGIGAWLVFAVAAGNVLEGRLTVGELIAACALAGMLFAPIARFSDLATQYQQVFAGLTRLGEIFNHPIDSQTIEVQSTESSAGGARRLAGAISFQRVCFSYLPERAVLSDFSLRIPPGSRIAIVGRTGSGKTTVMNLLLRFYQPSSGKIALDNRPLGEFSNAMLRREIGVVPQEAFIFRGTLADNIRYGTPEATSDQVQAAARAAFIHDLALSLPEQYETFVGEGGHPLSQGERQRIALARLFCKNPSIVVLDEATSALDEECEALVQKALDRLLAGRTTLVIAHRLATVKAAEQIVVMDEGRIAEAGTHEELLAAGGLYQQLCNAQFAASDERSGKGRVERSDFAAIPA